MKIKAYYRCLPDATLWVTEYNGAERLLAQWKRNYDHPENKPKDGMFGTIWDATTKERFTFNNLADWVKKLYEIYDIDNTKFKAESWSSGLWHTGRLSNDILYQP
jgi:hypothetical protein